MRQNRSIFILLALSLLIGIFTLHRYGESWDDLSLQKYAARSLDAYRSWLLEGEVQITQADLGNYGPSYVMGVSLVSRFLGAFLPLSLPDVRHLIYFITFLAGMWAFYALSLRWLSRTAAMAATLLLMTQPVFWGHAFINPKDTNFLAFFLLSLYFGFRLFDSPKPFQLNNIDPRNKRSLALLSGLWLATVCGLFLFTDAFHTFITTLVQSAKAGNTNILSWIASDLASTDAEVYIRRYFLFFIQLRFVYFILSTLILIFLYRKLSPSTLSSLFSILLPASFLGFATSMRILGPFAGLLVGIYAVYKKGKQAIPALFVYAVIALIVMYVTWPYLWPDPIGRFIESIQIMSQYPWQGQVLFDGVQYSSADIPRSYVPVLLGIQLTEPAWALFFAGLTVAIIGLVKRREYVELLALTAVWFILPLAGFIVTRAPLYDNFRQIFFILPPVFMLASVAFEKIKQKTLQIALIALVLLPGLIGIVRLYPYEYMYYNTFIGGEAGAFRRFELDYWGTSYREAAGWMNEFATPGANVWVDGPSHLLELYLRDGFHVFSGHEADRVEHYDYVVSMTRYDFDLTSYPDAEVVYRVEKDGVLLAVIKQP
ncbi:MAG: hypothetical protein JW963_20250 [Anaerolineales bacterium]|nr:hypothetical protein [Anaerolineales bacterium]